MATSGQTLNDRINAARYALAGQGLARCVCKATTEEVIGPKKKHLDYLIACTHEPNVSIPQLANLLIERTNHIYWVVVFKALVTVHHLMSYGNERFTQYLASSNYSFELSTFLDKTTARDFSMSTFIRRYSRYINEKALSYRLLAFDFCKVKRGNDGVLRIMPIDRLLKTLPILQNQLDALLEFDCGDNDLNNGVINACFMLLFRDLIGLFACHNDGIINLLNKYFTLNRKMCREAFDLYKKFLVRMDKVSDFLRVAEVVGIDKDEIPDLRRAPSSLIDALEQHLQNIESNKKILKQQQSSSNNNNNNNNITGAKSGGEPSVLGSLTPPSPRRPNTPNSLTNNNSTTNQATKDEFSINSFKDDEVRKALEEEARVLSQYGTDGTKNKSSSSSSKVSESLVLEGGGAVVADTSQNKIPTSVKSIDDIFGDADSFATSPATNGLAQSSNNNLNGTLAYENFNSTSNSSSTAKHQRQTDIDSIKLAIKSATSTLEKSNLATSNSSSSSESKRAPKKASDDLLSLLDASVSTVQAPTLMSQASSTLLGGDTQKPSQPPTINGTTLSPFASSPFELPINTNGQPPVLKPGNPFPDISSDFSSNPLSSVFSSGFNNNQPQPPTTSVFKSNVSTSNYTNLGGLEGFGELLQPMSSGNKSYGSNTSSGTSKPSFNSGAGLSSTGLFKGDLDSTLANLAQNLTFDGISKAKK